MTSTCTYEVKGRKGSGGQPSSSCEYIAGRRPGKLRYTPRFRGAGSPRRFTDSLVRAAEVPFDNRRRRKTPRRGVGTAPITALFGPPYHRPCHRLLRSADNIGISGGYAIRFGGVIGVGCGRMRGLALAPQCF